MTSCIAGGQAVGKLKVGDVIVEINGTSIRGVTSRDASIHVKMSERVELMLGDPNEVASAAFLAAFSAAAAGRTSPIPGKP